MRPASDNEDEQTAQQADDVKADGARVDDDSAGQAHDDERVSGAEESTAAGSTAPGSENDSPEDARTEESSAAKPAPRRAPGKARRRRAASRRKEREGPPLANGQIILASLLLLGIGLMSNPGLNKEVQLRTQKQPVAPQAATWQEGAEVEVDITLITADRDRLSCAHDDELEGGIHCAYNSKRKRRSRAPDEPYDDNQKNVIQPYKTASTNELILLSGLWATPELVLRYAEEYPKGVDAKKLTRFTARCKVEIVGKFDKVGIRWDTTGRWYDQQGAIVGRAKQCHIEPPSAPRW